jgi:hypothetical protein
LILFGTGYKIQIIEIKEEEEEEEEYRGIF